MLLLNLKPGDFWHWPPDERFTFLPKLVLLTSETRILCLCNMESGARQDTYIKTTEEVVLISEEEFDKD